MFIPAYEYFQETPAWSRNVAALERQFDQICGDTFCEGDFADLRSLGIDCSVDPAAKTIGRCIWTFAGTDPVLDPATGRFAVARKIAVCPLPFAGAAAKLAGRLALDEPLMDALRRCL